MLSASGGLFPLLRDFAPILPTGFVTRPSTGVSPLDHTHWGLPSPIPPLFVESKKSLNYTILGGVIWWQSRR